MGAGLFGGLARTNRGSYMKPYKTVFYSFCVGGVLALIAQAILSFWQSALTGTPMEFFTGGATLVSMGLIGCVLGGFACYQYVEEWATFGALLPFSGFAMAVGMKGVGPWTKENASMGKCVWNCVWFVIWFNVVFMLVCVVIGYVCGMMGVQPGQNLGVAKTEGGMLFFNALWVGGLLAAFFQILFLVCKSITSKTTPLHILMTAWMLGAILAPFGISGALANFAGQGFSVMITVGGYNTYNIGMDLFLGGEHAIAGLVHLGSFALAVCGLALTALFTFWIYNAIFGRKPINEVHAEKALHSLEELGYDASMVKVAKVEEQEGFDEGADGTPVGTGGAVDANDDGIIDVTGDVVDK